MSAFPHVSTHPTPRARRAESAAAYALPRGYPSDRRTRRMPKTTRHRRGLEALAAASIALTIAACGTSHPTTASSPHATGAVLLSECMRAHGLTNFPDPTQGAGGVGFNGISQTPGIDALTVDGITFAGPAWDAARKTCQKYLPAGGRPGPKLTQGEMATRVARSECMRTHGVTNFPDPNTRGGVNLPPTIDTNSPAFARAAQHCNLAKLAG
jgi:hypothetical protein